VCAVVHFAVRKRGAIRKEECGTIRVFDMVAIITVFYDIRVGWELDGWHVPEFYAGLAFIEHHETIAARAIRELPRVRDCGRTIIGHKWASFSRFGTMIAWILAFCTLYVMSPTEPNSLVPGVVVGVESGPSICPGCMRTCR